MIVYEYKQHEYLLAKWYGQLVKDGDFDSVFHASLRPMTDFLDHFRKWGLMFILEDDQIVAAMWGTPFMDGVTLGLWLVENKRANRKVVEEIMDCLERATTLFPVLIA